MNVNKKQIKELVYGDIPTQELKSIAFEKKKQLFADNLSFSPKVFIPLTTLCQDHCSYCTFVKTPGEGGLYLTESEVLAIAKAGELSSCSEALFTLGDKPELKWKEAQEFLSLNHCISTDEYLLNMMKSIVNETTLFPHANPGLMTKNEIINFKQYSISGGVMIETFSNRLMERGNPHYKCTTKSPDLRVKTIKAANEIKYPMTTGLLIGIGQNEDEVVDDLWSIAKLTREFECVQEVIIQNFRAKKEIPMNSASELSLAKSLGTVAQARIILGEHMNIQVPPNLSGPPISSRYLQFLRAGINDWGGISPVTIDYVNPEAPWPHLTNLRKELLKKKFVLKARFPVYPEYINKKSGYLPEALKNRLVHDADPSGFIPQKSLRPIWEAHFAS